jgi:hypothetical protein
LVIRAFMSRRLTPAKAGKLISEAFALALMGTLWYVLSRHEALAAPWPPLLLGAFFPGFIYDHAVFPTSMVSVFLLLALVLCADGRFLAAGCFGALAAFTYSTGVLVALAIFLGVALRAGLSRADRALAVLKAPLLCVMGAAAGLGFQWPTVGAEAFFRMQKEYYGNALGNPISTFAWNTARVWHGELSLASVPHVQTLLVAVLVLSSCLIWAVTRKSKSLLDTLLLLNALVYWLVPQIVGKGVSIYRSEALLIGLVPLLGHLPSRAGMAAPRAPDAIGDRDVRPLLRGGSRLDAYTDPTCGKG